MKESNIVYETTNFHLLKESGKFKLCLNGATHAVVVGTATDEQKGKDVIDKLEKYPDSVRRAYNHY